MDPQRYNQPVRDCGRLIPVRDEQDILLVKAAMTRKIPMLGICRGLQIMAVAMGGDLYQDVQKEAEKGLHELTMFRAMRFPILFFFLKILRCGAFSTRRKSESIPSIIRRFTVCRQMEKKRPSRLMG